MRGGALPTETIGDDALGKAITPQALVAVHLPEAAILSPAKGRLKHPLGHGQIIDTNAAGVNPAREGLSPGHIPTPHVGA